MTIPELLAAASAAARSWGRRYPHLADEFESAALVAVARALRSRDPARGTLAGLVGVVVRRGCLDVLRHWAPRGFRSRRHLARSAAPTAADLDLSELPSADLPVGWELEAADEVDKLCRAIPAPGRDWVAAAFTRADCATFGKTAGRAGGASGAPAARRVEVGLARLRRVARLSRVNGVGP